MNQTIRSAHLRADALSLAPAQLRARFTEARVRFESAHTGCNIAIENQLEEGRKRLGLAAASLDALSPLAVLQRGYAIAQTEDGKLLRDARLVSVGDSIKVRLAEGRIAARVEGSEEQ
jgi:exodeoxyribonuclease VII large subunit